MSLRATFATALSEFKAKAKLTKQEENDFEMTSLTDVHQLIAKMQKDQEDKRSMKFMRRLEPILKSMEAYGKVVEVFLNVTDVLAFVWGPMKFILIEASTHVEALNAILDAYQNIGENIPLLADFDSLLGFDSHMEEIIGMIYADILEFHHEVLKHFRKPVWKKIFSATWRGSLLKIEHIVANMKRHRQLIESRVTIMHFQETCALRQRAENDFAFAVKAEDDRRRDFVKSWLFGFSNDNEQSRFRDLRGVVADSGRWLLKDPRFQDWFNLNYCSTPVLWLTGIPGAGKTILASVVVDELLRMSQTSHVTVAYFYCKYADERRNSFLSVARSLIAQLISASSGAFSYIYEKASMSNDANLTSKTLAKELLDVQFGSCMGNTIYLVIDGVDECEREDRKEIATWFQVVSDSLPIGDKSRFRCLFVSQDDGVARRDFGQLPTIRIGPKDNRNDIESFAAVRHKKIEEKFGELRASKEHITNIVTATSQGMFVFAKLVLLHLEDLPTRQDLLYELEPSKLSVQLDDMYGRIMQRMTDSRTEARKREVRRVLGWVVCAPRPLRWREVQAATSIDLGEERANMDQKLLETPKGLLAAFIEVRDNGMVELVHKTARDYLVQCSYIELSASHTSMAILSMAYLGLPQMKQGRNQLDTKKDLLEGVYGFFDYASACWAVHLQAGITNSISNQTRQQLQEMQETLEAFIEAHESTSPKRLSPPKTIKEALSSLSYSENFDKIIQVLAWFKKQLGIHSQAPSDDEALELWKVTGSIRSALESMHDDPLISPSESRCLKELYGDRWFKCPRISCFYYHEGFLTATQRERHIQKHDRPFLCVLTDCLYTTFGFAAESELKRHFFEHHGIDMLEDCEFPAPIRETGNSRIVFSAESNHKCHLCSKSFTRSHNLKSHLRSHTGDKLYKCTVCEKSFSRSGDRSRHERLHDGEKVICFGTLEDGTEWGWKRCIMPLVKERLQKSGANEPGALTSGREVVLPSFSEFLTFCGLEVGVTQEHSPST